MRIGQFIDNRYEILDIIGSGGMADVYKAKCHKLNRIVAIKMLKKDYLGNAELVSRFQIEAQAAACLSHGNIVAIYDVGQSEEYQYIVMEYVEGKTLKALIEEQGALEEKEIIAIATQIAQGLDAAHQQGIIHRDIKPQNILISSDGKAKVADFGIARIARFSNTIELMPAGSVHYIAPEQARGGYCDERSDIYALGVTMYEMATGVVPFDGENAVAIAVSHMNDPVIEPVKRNEAVSPALNSIILKCMNKKPDDRYPNVMALILDLKKAVFTPGVVIASSAVGAAGVVGATKTQTIIMDSNMVNQLKKENGHLGEGEKKMADLKNNNHVTEEELEEKATLVDKIILGLGIGMGVLILAAVIYVVASISSLWAGSDNNKPSKPETTTSSESKTEDGKDETSSNEDGLADDETTMPNVLGMDVQDAIRMLDEYDLQYKLPKSVYSEEYKEGTICKQQYKEGTVLKKHTEVEIILSLGDGKFEITDNLIQMSRQLFEVKVRGYGLDITYIEQENDDYRSGVIFKTDPESGTLERGDKLIVYVSKGPSYSKMPNLLNLTQDEAIATIEQCGLVVGNVDTEYSNDVEAGLVCGQSIAARKKVKNGTSVDIVISLGRKKVTVPNVVGLTEEKAIEKLEENELSIGTVTYESSNSVKEGLVISQTPVGYEKAYSKDAVDLVISSGKKSLDDISELVGKTENEVKGLLSTVGLRYVKSEYEYHDTIKAGCVIAVEYYDKETKEHYAKDELFEGDYVVLIVSEGKEEETTEEETTAPETTEVETTKAPETTAAPDMTVSAVKEEEETTASETVTE